MTLKSRLFRISMLQPGKICLSEASFVSNSTTSPGSTVTRGAMLLSQRQCVRSSSKRYLLSIAMTNPPSFFNINLVATRQGCRRTRAQQGNDNQTKHKPGGTDGTGQVERRGGSRYKLRQYWEDQHNKRYRRQDYMPRYVEIFAVFAQVEERHGQSGSHVHYQDENGDVYSYERKGRPSCC